MSPEILPELDRILVSPNSARSLDFLSEHFRENKNFALLFESRLMKKRLELGLPLIQTEDSSAFPEAARAAYDQGMIDAAREAGTLFLSEGNIERAWPYFRAIGDTAPVVQAIDEFKIGDTSPEELAPVIGIAFQEGVHPAKGLQLILEAQGMCRAITSFGMYGVQKDREQCISLLVSGIHAEIISRMRRVIESQEGKPPEQAGLLELMANRDYLFGEYDYYVDTSHLVSVLPYCVEVTRQDTLTLYHELCEYGKRLSPQFHSKGEPPFEDPYVDYGYYINALRGVGTDEAVAHFQEVVAAVDAEEIGPGPAQTLVNLLARLGRHREALSVSLKYLGAERNSGACPSALQLCFLAGDFERLKELAAGRGDLLSYVAASLVASSAS